MEEATYATFNDATVKLRLPKSDLDDIKYLLKKHYERNPYSSANVSSFIRIAIRELIRMETESLSETVETV